ncbi:Glucose-1-phosphate adenylyltransferase [Candidatus Promineifilum breve]|uniref:Glucose-1-phosphate adenylyltransferase n=1 Tax=Candidatus Promineifilum breve TaxID=1806508 RepID=A0A160T701_9CHLR|nr:glucose-1-phosphate adenylyltransferase [Candidatus Promineifilum breve]CUS05078.2 Glucose-1-phosphate adenylyltransferase [Candidatus Promineifilum breve]
MPYMKSVLGLILGGGQGARLYPLTKERSKPAVPLAGKYRLIDIPMSNCFHADIEKIAILTQFNSASLHRHIWSTYTRDQFSPGWIQILAAEQTPHNRDWYQGTADAVRKQWVEIKEAGTRYVLILAGDHLYRMDYRKFVQRHIDSEAHISVAVQPVSRETVSGLGILKMGSDSRITNFTEKPKDPEILKQFESGANPDKPFLASMGIYVFNTDVLQEVLEEKLVDFGRDILPQSIDKRRVCGYTFDGFWEDIGTIRRFFEVNLRMAKANAPFDFYAAHAPIFTHARFLPGSEVQNSRLDEVLLADGCRIYDSTVRESVVGLRSIIGSEANIQSSILMGADYYETDAEKAENRRLARPDIGIGENAVIKGAIVDKNARIGRDVTIRYIPDRPEEETESWVARDGIVIVPKNAIVPDNTVI